MLQPEKKKTFRILPKVLLIVVGVVRFELTTPCSQSRCANRAALHPEKAIQKYELFSKIQCESG